MILWAAALAAVSATSTVELRGLAHLSQEERLAWAQASQSLPPLDRLAPLVLHIDAQPTQDGLAPGPLDVSASRLTLHPVLPSPTRGEDFVRAVLFALFWNLDQRTGWSQHRRWRAFNDWRTPLSGPLTWTTAADNQHPEGFLSARGRESPRADLAQTAAALWLESEASHRDTFSCRFPNRAHWLRERMAARWGRGALPPAPPCPALERWSNLEALHSVELILASPSAASAGSLFGHLALRLVYRNERGETPLHLSRTIAFLADSDDPMEEDPLYAFKGITGVYGARLYERPFLHTLREYVLKEDRDLRRWRLHLTAEEAAALLRRIYAMKQSTEYAYYFFLRNCATLLFDMINSALAEGHEADLKERLTAGPAAVVEALTRTEATDGQPRLEFLPEAVISGGTEARWASQQRSQVAKQLAQGHPHLAEHLKAARAAHAAQRAAAYRALGPALAALREHRPLVESWWHHTAIIEAHLNAMHNLEQEKALELARRAELKTTRTAVAERVNAAASTAPWGETWSLAAQALSAAEREARMDGYLSLEALLAAPGGPSGDAADRMRLFALLTSELEHDVSALKAIPNLRPSLIFPDRAQPVHAQGYVQGYEHLIRVPVHTEISEALLAAQKARLLAARQGPWDGPQTAQRLAATRVHEEAVHHRRSLPETGLDGVGLAAVMDTDNPKLAGLALSGALHHHRLGDQRQQGFDPFTELVVARSRVQWVAPRGRPYVLQSQVRWLGIRRLGKGLAEADGLWQRLGWYGHVESESDRRRRLAFAGRVEAGVSLLLWARHRLADHILLDAGAAYDIYMPHRDAGLMEHNLALPLRLAVRYSLWPEGSFGHVLHASVMFDPRIDPIAETVTPQVRAQVETQARLADAIPLPVLGATALNLVAGLRYDYGRMSYRSVPEHRTTLQVGVVIP